jgi:cell division protein FtsB
MMNAPAQQPRDFASLFGSGRSIDGAIDCLRVAAGRLEELERDRDEARMQHRTTELLGSARVALVQTIDELKAEKAAIFAQLISLQAGSRRASLDEIAESVREKYEPEHEGEGIEN